MNFTVEKGLLVCLNLIIKLSVKKFVSCSRLSLILPIFIFFCSQENKAQSQSGRVYEFLNLPATARITALGGYAVPGVDHDLGMALFYPSLLKDELSGQLSLNFADYLADINYGTVAFNRRFNKAGNLAFALQYINYGRFTEADEFGNQLGDFSAGEYAFSAGWGRMLSERISIGSNLKTIFSSFEAYSSWGVAVDVAVSYFNPENLISGSLVVRNIGRQITTYSGAREALPFDIVLGLSKKLENAPLRFSLAAHNLHKWDLTYDDPLSQNSGFMPDENSGQATAEERLSQFTGKLFRHTVVGVEFTPTSSIIASIGYNYRRRQEMKLDTRTSTVGLSFGLGVKVSHFKIHYGRANYHLAGAPNHFSLSASLEDLFARPASRPVID
jgi:hypothetical protein